ncbi:hypothetical protein K439DRAFT_1535943 [Ramaria rubella]|nr:hypothetical protein K439DRAFT_1535943 [Ramaria rubella]
MDTSAHKRNISVGSALSLLSSDFSDKTHVMMNNTRVDTEQFVREARQRLETMKSKSRRLERVPSSLEFIDVDPHKVLFTMLDYAPTDNGRRYVACAILACEGELDEQVDLANTWLRYLLLPIKGNSDQRAKFNPSENATPTLDHTQQAVIQRDGFQCVVTGCHDDNSREDLRPRAFLEAAHIVKRALAVFRPDQLQCASVTWEIIRQYTHWSESKLATMMGLTDSPQNGLMMELNYHRAWDKLHWTLAPVVSENGILVPDTYRIKALRSIPDIIAHKDIITFRDYSVTDEVYWKKDAEKQFQKVQYGVPLPDREFIAFHHAIAHVLHMSGAGDAIDLAMHRLYPQGPTHKMLNSDELALQLSSLQLMDTMGMNEAMG